MERLDKIIAGATGESRKSARGMILRGRVAVNGKVAGDIAQKVNPDDDYITINNERVAYKKYIYVMINKPEGILSASDDKTRKTVVDLVKERFLRDGLFPVGRLDKNTTGLLIVTDDGDFGHRVISPKSGIEKEYTVGLDKPISDSDIEKLQQEVILSDGTVCRPAKVTVLGDRQTISMVITEGKYHEIKRMLGTVGIGVNSLERKRIGALCLDVNLHQGECRELSATELTLVFK